MRGSVACQTVGRSARAKAALSYRLHNIMIASTPVSNASRRVPTYIKSRQAVYCFPGLEGILDACCRVREAERSLPMHAQHGKACPCMYTDTHIYLCGAV